MLVSAIVSGIISFISNGTMLKLIAQRFCLTHLHFSKSSGPPVLPFFLGAMAVKTGNDQFALDLARWSLWYAIMPWPLALRWRAPHS